MASKTHHKKKVVNDPSFRKKKPLEYFPVQRRHSLALAPGAAFQACQFDAGRILSQTNHRLYRYGKRYKMKVDLDPSAAVPGVSYTIWKLSDTWMNQKAFEEAAIVFKRAYTDERENLSKEQRARWFDFRIASGLDPATTPDTHAVVDANPISAPYARVIAGEFLGSIVEDAAGVTRTFSWAGATTATDYSVIAEYDLAGNTTTNPTTSTGAGPYDDLEADASAVEMDALQDRGNLPPYAATTLPSVWTKVGSLEQGAAGAQKLSTGMFEAPCGLICIVATGGTMNAADNLISVEFASGDYKGVSAHNMERL